MKHESYEGHSLLSVISIWNRVSSPYRKLYAMWNSIRIRYNHTCMVQKNIPYAYGTYRTRTVCTIRVWYEIRVRYTTELLSENFGPLKILFLDQNFCENFGPGLILIFLKILVPPGLSCLLACSF